jgi:predicted CXXCH cytochrome family protein
MQKVSDNSLQARQSISETCFQCHKQQRAEFRKRSHMPLPEGKLSCVDCHNPHGSSSRALLNADSVNDVCYTCTPKSGGRSSGNTRLSARVASTVTSLTVPTMTSCSWGRAPTCVSNATTSR